jgi:hypothetical protein
MGGWLWSWLLGQTNSLRTRSFRMSSIHFCSAPSDKRLERSVKDYCRRATSALRFVALALPWTRLRPAAQPHR